MEINLIKYALLKWEFFSFIFLTLFIFNATPQLCVVSWLLIQLVIKFNCLFSFKNSKQCTDFSYNVYKV